MIENITESVNKEINRWVNKRVLNICQQSSEAT